MRDAVHVQIKGGPMTSLRDIRKGFLDFFAGEGHQVEPSAPLVPDDPTLLFTNAGMVPFKNAFVGAEKPIAPRVTTSQKCVRAGGKHNDLDNVGYTARHHTFFEMLGNFSFGDYFKAEAIDFAWRLVTKEFALPVDKLLVTVYAEDEEAAGIWKKVAGLTDDRIIRIATSDNFWSMGDTGPCGPCSEIFYDHGPEIWGGPPGSPEEDGDRWVEIWNLVFMQYDQGKDGKRTNLPKPSIDTGMGLERVAAVLQGVHSNYDTDLFQNLINASITESGKPAEGDAAASHRVIADHLRSSAFLIADGVSPSNEGRGYVLRRIMRRAMRHAHLLGAEDPLMHRLAPTLVSEMGEAFPELKRAEPAITATLEQEEIRFRATLGRGLALLDDASAGLGEGDALAGETAFKLYDTYGFPLDLTQDALRSRGIEVDVKGFDAAMAEQKAKARASWSGSGDAGHDADWATLRADVGPTAFVGYTELAAPGVILALVKDGEPVEFAGKGDVVDLVTDVTPFYGESGGQIGDSGALVGPKKAAATVIDTQKRAGDLHVHRIEVTNGKLAVGDTVELDVYTARRRQTEANHSATHLAHAALRDVLGPHVTQKGSYVGPDRLRFDFTHGGPLTGDEIAAIEAQVNAIIRQNAAADTKEMSPDAAVEAGALALFGEKYGDVVRVLRLGDALEGEGAYSVELCGGAHVGRTGDIALFKIVAETAVAAGVRRIEALTGEAAKAWLDEQAGVARAIADAVKTPPHDALARVLALQDERKRLERELADANKKLAMGGGASEAAGPEEVGGVSLIARVADGVAAKDLRALVDQAKESLGSGVAAFVGVNGGKAALVVGVTSDLAERVDARELVRAGAAAVGGKGGGGRADLAQAGGPDGDKAQEAVAAIRAELVKASQEPA